MPNLEDGVLASWDDVDPQMCCRRRRPARERALDDVDAARGRGGSRCATATGVPTGSPNARRGGTDRGTDGGTGGGTDGGTDGGLTPDSSLLPECESTHATPSVANEPKARASEDFPTRADPDACARRGVRARDRARRRKTRGVYFCFSRRRAAAAVPTELSRRPPKADDSANAGSGVAADRFRKQQGKVRRNFRRALLVGCAYFRAAAPGADAPARRAERRRGGPRGSGVPVRARRGRPGPNADPIDRPGSPPKEGGSFFGGFSPKREPPSSSDAWKTGLAPPRLTSDVPNVPNVPAEGDTPQGGVEGNDDMSQNVPDSGTTAYPTDAPHARARARRLGVAHGRRPRSPATFCFSTSAGTPRQQPWDFRRRDGRAPTARTRRCARWTRTGRRVWAPPNTNSYAVVRESPKRRDARGERRRQTLRRAERLGDVRRRRRVRRGERAEARSLPQALRKRAQTHDEIFGRFVPPKAVAAEIARRTAEARATQPETRRARAAAAERTRRARARRRTSWWRSWGATPQRARRAARPRARMARSGSVHGGARRRVTRARVHPSPKRRTHRDWSAIRDCTRAARDAKALAAAAAAARDRREKAFVVEKCDARAQTPIAVVAYEGTELDGGAARDVKAVCV